MHAKTQVRERYRDRLDFVVVHLTSERPLPQTEEEAKAIVATATWLINAVDETVYGDEGEGEGAEEAGAIEYDALGHPREPAAAPAAE